MRKRINLKEEIKDEIISERAHNKKVYMLNNGKRAMVITKEPMHYLNQESGEFEEINAELYESEQGFSGKCGDCEITLPDGEKNVGCVQLKKGPSVITWEYLGVNVCESDKKKRIIKKHPKPYVDSASTNLLHMMKHEHKNTFVQYGDIENGIDVEYEVRNNLLKENIVIRQKRENYEFDFLINVKNLVPVIDEYKHSINFYSSDENECRFIIPEPIMFDAKKAYSKEIEYMIKSKGNDEYVLTIKADSEWINDPYRAMPVYIDPVVQFTNDCLATIDYTNSKSGFAGIAVGYDGSVAWTSDITGYICIPKGAVVCNSYLCLEEYQSSGDANFCWSVSGTDGEFLNNEVYVGRIGDEQNSYMVPVSLNVALSHIFGQDRSVFHLAPYYTFDSCCCDSNSNCECCDECGNPCVSDMPTGSIEFNPTTSALYIEYEINEEYMDNQSIIEIKADCSSVTDNVNLFTGEVIHTQFDIGTGGIAFPINVTHRFKSSDRGIDFGFGSGWNLSLEQSVLKTSGLSFKAEYWDGDGKKHYFIDTDEGCIDTGGLNLMFSENISGYTITDRNGGKLEFSFGGKLSKICDANGNCATITRDSSDRITLVRDNFGREIAMTYNDTTSRLSRMTDSVGRSVIYTYDSINLRTVSFPDGTTIQYEYDSVMRISKITHEDGTKTVYTYLDSNDENCDRVVKVEKYAADANIETDLPVEYRSINYISSGTTEVTDRTGITKVYAFDANGRTMFEYEKKSSIATDSDQYGTYEIIEKTATETAVCQYTDKKRTFASSLRSSYESDNMIVNGDFSNTSDGSWVFVGTRQNGDGYGNNHYRIIGSPSSEKYIKQRINADDIKVDYGDTLILSAWAHAESSTLPGIDEYGAKFELRAETHYTDGYTEKEVAEYETEYTSWQYAALPIRIDKNKTLDYITVYLDYSKNVGTCRFDNVRLVNAPSRTVTYEKNINDGIIVFGSNQTICERVTLRDGVYTVTEEKNEKYDVVRRTIADMAENKFVSLFKYDDSHRVIFTQNDRNIITEATYNSVGMQTSVKTYYWSVFNPMSIPNPTEFFYQKTTYDETGEFVESVGDARSDNIKVLKRYDKVRGLILGTTSPNGQNTEIEYDAQTDLVTKVSCIAGSKEYSVLCGYDEVKRLSSITHNGFDYDFVYDEMGRMNGISIAGDTYLTNNYILKDTTKVSTTYISGEKMTIETDCHNQPIKSTYTNKNGLSTVVVEGKYDSLGKPIEILDKTTNMSYTYEYDSYGNVTKEKIDDEMFKTYEYDEHNRLTSTTVKVGDGTHVYRSIYDSFINEDGETVIRADNAVVGVTLDGKFTARAEHDNLGRVTRKSLKLNGATSALIAEELTYLSTAEGTNTRLSNMVESFTNKVNGVEVDKLTYVYDNNGNIIEIKRDGEVLIQYAYDGLNQLIREDNAVLGKICTYTYDTAGNITEKKVFTRNALGVGVLEQTIPYTYSTTGWKDRLTSYNGRSITYDALGNPTSYMGHNLVWGKIRQLQAYDNNSFTYNAVGVRTSKNGITYELNGTEILREVRGANVIEYFYGASGVSGFNYNGIDYYYQKNIHGDIVAIYTAAGIKVAEYVYDAWGKCTVLLDTIGIGTINPYRYRSYYYDIETGLYYLQSRYYDPEVGRFINADEVTCLGASGTILGYNLYAYCENNAPNLYDPKGYSSEGVMLLGSTAQSMAEVLPTIMISITTAMLSIKSAIATACFIAVCILLVAVAIVAIVTVVNQVAKFIDGASKVIEKVKSKAKSKKLKKEDLYDNTVYVICPKKTIDVVYVGITKNFGARYTYHTGPNGKFPKDKYDIIPIATGLSRREARAMEQVIITAYTIDSLVNMINSISREKWGDFLREFSQVSSLMQCWADLQ